MENLNSNENIYLEAGSILLSTTYIVLFLSANHQRPPNNPPYFTFTFTLYNAEKKSRI